ncbi:membrane protein [Afipia sp. P52-10]|uniref:heme biosynthesis protein HemY n=1 Tax=Afipia sp. P52-10 TaxID=1429916 RepID=UPI0003DF1D56|nr:heme biosynthesis HemY N-terminal domain-containing protein [Afipia sp. P52-10]ETR77896.1 membrane protein [Afipia sp. P52-10]
MVRVIVFLLVIGVLAFGASWVADQGGDIVLAWDGWRVSTSLPVAILGFGLAVVAAMVIWVVISTLIRLPQRLRHGRQLRHERRGREAIAKGLIAIGAGDRAAARRHATIAERHAQHDPLRLLLAAQSAQLAGDHDGARRAFHAMAERPDTRLLGLHGLFIEAQRNDDPLQAVAAAEEALKVTPTVSWASHAVLGFRCAQNDWTGALAIVERNTAAGAIDKATYRRQRAVLLTARALELETADRDLARESVMEAIKLAPTLIPAAVLAARFLSENQQTRKAMQMIEAAWAAQPHPDLADAYAHVRLGDSALERLRRMERLAEKAPGHAEGALGVARVAIDAREFTKAREALAPLLAVPTQRVALLMAEIERGEHDDEGAARAWTMRAVHAALDPAWTADGYVSDRWRPVSPVTGRLDAFRWMVPVAALPSLGPAVAEPVTPPIRKVEALPADSANAEKPDALAPGSMNDRPPASEAAVPVFRPRTDIRANAIPPAIPAVIPIVRAPDDPGVDDHPDPEAIGQPEATARQEGGFRGFLSRWVG